MSQGMGSKLLQVLLLCCTAANAGSLMWFAGKHFGAGRDTRTTEAHRVFPREAGAETDFNAATDRIQKRSLPDGLEDPNGGQAPTLLPASVGRGPELRRPRRAQRKRTATAMGERRTSPVPPSDPAESSAPPSERLVARPQAPSGAPRTTASGERSPPRERPVRAAEVRDPWAADDLHDPFSHAR